MANYRKIMWLMLLSFGFTYPYSVRGENSTPASRPSVSVGLVYGSYSWGGYTPYATWQEPLKELGWSEHLLKIQDCDSWLRTLDQYDVLIFTNYYKAGYEGALKNKLAPHLKNWLAGGKLLIIEGIDDKNPVDWLSGISPAWTMSAAQSQTYTWLPKTIKPEFSTPHSFPDGLWFFPRYVAKTPQRPWPMGLYWKLATPNVGEVLVMNEGDEPLLWTDRYKNGTVFATTMYNGYGMSRYLLENMWSQHLRKQGKRWTPVLKTPTPIAEVLKTIAMPKQGSPTKVAFNQDNIAMVDGKPFFPFGFYCVFREDSFRLMKENGFNFSYSDSFFARKYGIKTVGRATWNAAKVADQVKDMIPDPAIIAWELIEEMDLHGFDNWWIQYRMNLVRKLDPGRPAGLLFCNPCVIKGLGGLCDFIVLDCYTVRAADSSLSAVADFIIGTHAATKKAVWMCLQAHKWKDELIDPSPSQMRGEMYVSLAAGVKGIIWFALDDDKSDPRLSWVRDAKGKFDPVKWPALCELAKEFNQIQPWLVSMDQKVKVKVEQPGKGVYARVWSQGNRHLLIVANAEAKPCAVVMQAELPLTPIRGMFKSTVVKTSGNQVKLNLEGYGVCVYEMKNFVKGQ
jgi:hypothetical protein